MLVICHLSRVIDSMTFSMDDHRRTGSLVREANCTSLYQTYFVLSLFGTSQGSAAQTAKTSIVNWPNGITK